MVSIYLKIKILKTKTIELAETDTELQESIKSLENYVKHNCELASNTTPSIRQVHTSANNHWLKFI